MSKLRGAIVGSGLIAGKKHIPAFLKQKSRVDIAAICDLNLQAGREMANRFGIRGVYTDLSEMMSKEKLDFVDICTPPQTHSKVAVEAMRNGCHVLIEKPMASTLAECDEIVKCSLQGGVKVCVAHSDLFYRPFLKAREMVARGDIGALCGMRIFLSTPTEYMTSEKDHWAHKLPGGVIGETCPHAVYMSLALIGQIRDVNIEATRLLQYPWSQFEDYRVDLVGEKGVSSITLSYATDQWMARVDVLGRKGTLMLDLEGMSIVKYRRRKLNPLPVGLSLLSESAQIFWNALSSGFRFATGRLKSTHDVLVERFVDSILDGTDPPVTVEEGREAVRVTEMILRRLEEKFA